MLKIAALAAMPQDLRRAISKLCRRRTASPQRRAPRIACLPRFLASCQLRPFSSPAESEPFETTVIDTRTSNSILVLLRLHSKTEIIPDDEMLTLSNAIAEHYDLQSHCIRCRSPAVRRRSLREWQVLISFESGTELLFPFLVPMLICFALAAAEALFSYLTTTSAAESLRMFETVVQRALAPYATSAAVASNRIEISLPPARFDKESDGNTEENSRERLQSLLQVRPPLRSFSCSIDLMISAFITANERPY